MENIKITKNNDSNVFVSRPNSPEVVYFVQLSLKEITLLNNEVDSFLKRFDSLWLSYTKVSRLAKETTDYKARRKYLDLKVSIDKQLSQMKKVRDQYIALSHLFNKTLEVNKYEKK